MSWTQRTSAEGIRTSPYYFSTWNKFYPDYAMPNCTAYAYGRFAEGTGTQTQPTLSGGNADVWYSYTADGYERGRTPRVGAVICYRGGAYSGDGHVAIVEEIYQDGTILVTESGYQAYFWRQRVADPNNTYPYSNPSDRYEFLGFIYNPDVAPVPPEPDNWITGNRQLTRAEMDNNAIKFYYRASALGASYNAILGMLANLEDESWINPGVWESFIAYGGGYGLVQWTPYTKYSDWAGSGWEDNGNKEVEFLKFTVDHQDIPEYIQWFGNEEAPDYGYPVNPPLTLPEFWGSTTGTPKQLADYWVLYYEHPDEDLLPGRIAGHQAKVDYYNQLLGGGGPVPPIPSGKMPIWLIMKAAIDKKLRGLT